MSIFTPVISQKYNCIKGHEAWAKNLNITLMAAQRVRNCLGPNGSYKMITYDKGPEKVCKISKDVTCALEELNFEFPILCLLSESAKMQLEEMGDGANSYVVLVAALLREAAILVSKGVHPMLILDGYLEAKNKALESINKLAKPLGKPHFSELLRTIDCERGIITEGLKSDILKAFDTPQETEKFDFEKVHYLKIPGKSLHETRFIKGIVLEKEKCNPNMPDVVKQPKIALISGRFGPNRIEVKMRGEGPFNMKYCITSPEQLESYYESANQLRLVSLKGLLDLGVNAVFCQQPIDLYIKSKMSELGLLAFERVHPRDLAKLSGSTRAKVVCDPADLMQDDIGSAEMLETGKFGPRKTVSLEGCYGATFIIRGNSAQAMDEVELAISSSLKYLDWAKKNGDLVIGGGAIETSLALELDDFSKCFSERKQLAIASFGKALLDLPRCLAENNGLDSESVIAKIRNLHASGSSCFGVGSEGCLETVCIELAETKRAILNRAYEMLSLLLRINEEIMCRDITKVRKK